MSIEKSRFRNSESEQLEEEERGEDKKRPSRNKEKTVYSEEALKKMSAGGKKNKGKKRSTEDRKKMSEIGKGENNSNWKGGVCSKERKIKNSIEYRLWRECVLERDNYTCQKCGETKKLHAHHILNMMKYPDLMFNLDNGITLCEKDHYKFHKKYGGITGREELKRFIQSKQEETTAAYQKKRRRKRQGIDSQLF